MFGLTVFEWGDLEAYEDEWVTVTPAITVANIVNFLALDWRTCVVLPKGHSFDASLPIDQLCRSVREKMKLSRADFADQMGFFPQFCEFIEGHPRAISLYPIDVAIDLAKIGGLDSEQFVAKILAPSHAFRAPVPEDFPFSHTFDE